MYIMPEYKSYDECFDIGYSFIKSIGVTDIAVDTNRGAGSHCDLAARYYTGAYFGGRVDIDITIGNQWIWVHIDRTARQRFMTLALVRSTGAFDSQTSFIWLKW